jgi:hypothetical protein
VLREKGSHPRFGVFRRRLVVFVPLAECANTRLKSSAPQGPAHDFGQARLEKIDLRTDDEDVAEPDWVLQPVATGPATARTADIGTGAMASAS